MRSENLWMALTDLLILTHAQLTASACITRLEGMLGAISPKEKSGLGIFFDHLYFSVCCVLVLFLVVYGIARWTGHGFDLDDNFAVCVLAVVSLSLILAAYFTLVSTSERRSDFIIRTKREKK